MDRWVVDQDYPEGHLVPMTRAEVDQLERDRAASSAASNAQAEAEEAVASRIADLRRARIELAQGRIFSAFSESERRVLDLLLVESAPSI